MEVEKEQAIELLKTDLAAFNKWKQENPRERLDLSGADLSGVNLGGAQLGQVNLSGANLSGVDLTGAMLPAANLSEADLTGADLTDANLHRVDFQNTNLHDAKLNGFKEEGRLCLAISTFDGVSWEKEHLEQMLQVINLNKNWDIKYQIVPK
jgi:uncharacterized protein YjbI with pentapeptide repeats